MTLSRAQIRTLAEVKGAGRAVRTRRVHGNGYWTWCINGVARSRTVDLLLKAGCLAINDNNRDEATVTPFGRRVLEEVGQP